MLIAVDMDPPSEDAPYIGEDITFICEAASELGRCKEALKEILDVATISEGVEWYAFIADKALHPESYPDPGFNPIYEAEAKMGGKKS